MSEAWILGRPGIKKLLIDILDEVVPQETLHETIGEGMPELLAEYYKGFDAAIYRIEKNRKALGLTKEKSE